MKRLDDFKVKVVREDSNYYVKVSSDNFEKVFSILITLEEKKTIL